MTGKNLHVCNERKKHENINDCNPGRAGYDRFGTRIQGTTWPAKPVRAMATPPPLLQRPAVEGVIPRGFSDGRNPFQMLNPWAPARYGTWVDSTSFDPNHPGKWNGIKLFEIIF